jgi:hypothetical protein
MKKILVLIVVCVAYSISTFAFNPSDYKNLCKLNTKATFTGLVGYIDADQEQAAFLKRVFQVTDEELTNAAKNENIAAAENVVNYNLRNARCILSEEQYKKYIVFVNVYLNNDNNFAMFSENK